MTASRAYAQAAEPGNFFVAGKNILINGNMNIWQRGTSTVMTSTSFGPDRWQSYRGVAGSTVSRQATSDTTNLPFLTYCARVQRDSGNTSTSTIWFVQNIESLLSKPFAGKTATFSFYARAGANYSSASSLLNVRLRWGTGTDQNTLGTWTGGGFAISTTATLTTTWQRFTFTGLVDSTANELSAYVGFDGVGTAGAADYFEITGMQLEIGSVATPFTTATGTLAGELAACQRYYEKSYNVGTAIQTNTAVGRWNGTAQWFSTTGITDNKIQFKVPKRGTPTITLYRSDGSATNPNYWEYSIGSNEYYVAFTVINEGENSFGVYSNSGSGGTTNNATAVRGHWVASAEL